MGNIEAAVKDWSTEAADAFLNSGTPLNDSIRKIASRETLSREKVARVVEGANHQVFLKTFETARDKCFTFKVADVAEIVQPKAAPSGVQMVRITPGEKTGGQVKTASQRESEHSFDGTPIQIAKDYYEKAVLAADLLKERAFLAKDACIKAETQFAKIAQEMVGMEDYSFTEICDAAVSMRPRHAMKIATLLKAAAIHMGTNFNLPESVKTAMVKTAGAAVDPGEFDIVTQVSASGMPVEVINGAHRLVVALDTLIAQDTEADRANKNLWSADDTVKYLRTEIRNYMASCRTA